MRTIKKYEWCDLIEFFEKNHYIKNGLTIPYLIGALELLQERKMTISEFTDELLDPKNKKRPSIMKCGNIAELVIGVIDIYTINTPNSMTKSIGNLSAYDDVLNKFTDKMELINHFENLYQSKVDSGEYSKNDGSWTNFTPTDLERIEHYNKTMTI